MEDSKSNVETVTIKNKKYLSVDDLLIAILSAQKDLISVESIVKALKHLKED